MILTLFVQSVAALLADGFRYVTADSSEWNDIVHSCADMEPVYQRVGSRAYYIPDFVGHESIVRLLPLQPPDVAAAVSQMPDARSQTPCGVFDVGGHGYRELVFSHFPACVDSGGQINQPLAIQCLDAEGKWVAGTTVDVQINPNRKSMSFVSEQDGTCGIFLEAGTAP